MQTLTSNLLIYTTADGSPTLAFARDDGYVEKMHHSGGALSESLYIYQQALEIALKEKLSPRVLSLGLGLGYNELISLAEFERSNIEDFKIWSLEALPILQNAFRLWAGVDPELTPTCSPEETRAVSEVVANVANLVAIEMKIGVEKLRHLTKQSLDNSKLKLLGPYPQALPIDDKINIVYYDAYSNKMDSGPWSESTLTDQLGPTLKDSCVFATYAATGALNRGLKSLGFSLIPKAGFQGKRQSTLAIRHFDR